jgi:hypothetical protein
MEVLEPLLRKLERQPAAAPPKIRRRTPLPGYVLV